MSVEPAHSLKTIAPGTTIYAVGLQSVDPDEASIGGVQWSVNPDEITAFIESERTLNRTEVDYEYLRHTLTVPEGVTSLEEITDWVDEVVWDRSPERRIVILGSKYPGGERRRIEQEMAR